MLTPRIMKLHWYIDHDWQMTPIDFQVTRDDKDLRKVVDDPLNQIKELETKISALQTELSELKQKHGKTGEEVVTVAHGSAPTTKQYENF
ncbi:hypothetical protein DPMN_104256 [Dreissena polymorpha]|uniref:Uncharacterized protein n=1 Tax=Dreissena polymorpha TaxID=45954 RepID=A0A9D4HA20_DREPO|nr:hypothetical protein DPMN_104256 [Dreissena polymorpha]